MPVTRGAVLGKLPFEMDTHDRYDFGFGHDEKC